MCPPGYPAIENRDGKNSANGLHSNPISSQVAAGLGQIQGEKIQNQDGEGQGKGINRNLSNALGLVGGKS